MEHATNDFGTGLRRYLERNPCWRADGSSALISLADLFALFAEDEARTTAPPRLVEALAA